MAVDEGPVKFLFLFLAGCAAAPGLPPRGLPDSAWYPPEPAIVATPYQTTTPVVSGGGYSRQELASELVAVDCDAVIADWLSAREDFRREADAYQAKHCRPVMDREVRFREDGTRYYTGAFHQMWICDGAAMEVPNRPSGVSARRVDLQGCKPPH